MKFSAEFVLKVNEIFHNIEGIEYCHPECVKIESFRWQKVGKLISKNLKEKTILDVGSGLGFVPLQIVSYLKENDLLICSDLSSNLLEICKNRIIKKNFKCKLDFLKLDGRKYNIESSKLDYITVNSVLHHIPNFPAFFKEINRILKINGKIIICHEPNKLFSNNPFLWYNFRIIHLLSNPRELLITILKLLKLYKIGKKIISRSKKENELISDKLSKINKHLLNQDIIKLALTLGELTEIVDFLSPTAGGFHREKGIELSKIIENYIPNFKIEFFESYNHILKFSYKNKITRLYDRILHRIFPNKGALFFTILKKVS